MGTTSRAVVGLAAFAGLLIGCGDDRDGDPAAMEKTMRGLAAAKYLRAQATPSEATVSFADRVQRIARVHHYGETDAVNHPDPPQYDYPARPLLGISDADLQAITQLLMKHLQG